MIQTHIIKIKCVHFGTAKQPLQGGQAGWKMAVEVEVRAHIATQVD